MNDFSMVTVESPLDLFEKITFGECIAEFPLDLLSEESQPCYRLQADEEAGDSEDEAELCEAVEGVDPAESTLRVDIFREKATVDQDATQLVLAVADNSKTRRASSIEQAVATIRKNHIAPVQMVQCELKDNRIVCAKVGAFMMPCCREWRGFVCLNTNDVCIVDAPPLRG
jgi:hypothetical protein